MATNLKQCFTFVVAMSSRGAAKAHDHNLLQINAFPCLARTKDTASTVHWSLAFMASNLKQRFTFVVMQSPHLVAAKAHDQNLLQINASPCLARTKVTASTVHWSLALRPRTKVCAIRQIPGLKAKEEKCAQSDESPAESQRRKKKRNHIMAHM